MGANLVQMPKVWSSIQILEKLCKAHTDGDRGLESESIEARYKENKS